VEYAPEYHPIPVKTLLMILRYIAMAALSCSMLACNAQPGNRVKRTAQLPDSRLDSIDIDFRVRNWMQAGASKVNEQPGNGEARSENNATPTDNTFTGDRLYLYLNDEEKLPFDSSHLGCALYLVNKSKEKVTLNASDSQLYLTLEALEDSVWKPLSFIPRSWCGNSYHTLTLGANEYWQFSSPIFKGDYPTRIRYALKLANDSIIYSNEVAARINKKQLQPGNKQTHTATNIMDPYDE
jgi:hypothetical protein